MIHILSPCDPFFWDIISWQKGSVINLVSFGQGNSCQCIMKKERTNNCARHKNHHQFYVFTQFCIMLIQDKQDHRVGR